MGESLLQSYLKHVQKCLVTQTNWKTSSNWIINPASQNMIEYIYDKIKKNTEFSDVFKNNDLTQILKQAEVDVVGINGENKLYMVEVAFHEGGLNYGSKIETKNKIFEKLLRALLVATAYFKYEKLEIIFATPKTNPSTESIILDYFEILTREFGSEKVYFNFISNEDFKNEILVPTLKNTNNDADTSELFLRTYKMLNMFNLVIKDEKDNEKNQLDNNTYNNIVNQENERIENISDDNIHILKVEPKPHLITRNLSPEIDYYLNGEKVRQEVFKARLIDVKRASRIWCYEDGHNEEDIWKANNFTVESNLSSNIHSTTKYRTWKQKGLKKLILLIEK